jgi:hypothetical protein
VSDQVLLRDLVSIPERVHAGDFVLGLAKGIDSDSTVRDYVVTPQLAEDFDQALELIRSAVETNASRAAYLDGSFGSGKSHFMAVLHAILTGDLEARGKKGLADVVHKHDPWLKGRSFLLVPYHLPDSQSLDAAILGGYVRYVSQHFPGKPLPAVYADDDLIADARELREAEGDEKFIAQLPSTDKEAEEWGNAGWDTATLNEAFHEPSDGANRRRLVGDLLIGPFKRYARTIKADEESYISLDQGLSVISKHAKEILGKDAIVLLLDELVLWLAAYIGDHAKVSAQAQKVSKLIESAEHERPAPIISFVPRQRDLRELVSQSQAGAEVTSLFDTLKYWDGRFEHITLDNRNLPAIVHERLLKPKDVAAQKALDDAFNRAASVPPQTWETLLDTHGEKSADRDSFRLTYPFSPAFVHAMVDISGALQRERTALKLMQQLLVDYRDTLKLGQLMPLGAIFDVLAQGSDRPFTDKLRDEFDQVKRFYEGKLRPSLLRKHGTTEELVHTKPLFLADDLVVKTLLLAALVPNVPALNGLTATRLAALNHGSIVSMLPNQEARTVAATLKQLAAEFGEIRVSEGDNPRVDLAIVGVDTEGILQDAWQADDDSARRHLLKDLLWPELGLTDTGAFETHAMVVWRGTARNVDVVLDNVFDRDRMPSARFAADPDTIRLVMDLPFDDGHYPSDHRNRVNELRGQLDEHTIVWLAHFLSDDRKADLSSLIRINYILQRDRLAEMRPNFTVEERHHARVQLESRRAALLTRLREALRRTYGVGQPEDADLGPRVDDQVLSLTHGYEPRVQAGQGLQTALHRLVQQLLDHLYPQHPDFDPSGKGDEVKLRELLTVIDVVTHAAQDGVRYEVPTPGERAIMKKIGAPLKIGVMHEGPFVLSGEWKQTIDRKAAGREEFSVREVREWVTGQDLGRGLPQIVRDLVVVCYAIEADKAWIRGAHQIAMPELKAITGDMKLRSQELPSPEEFERANLRAAGIFEAPRQPVRNARTTQAIAQHVRERAGQQLPAAQSLLEELEQHADTLGLTATEPRLVTARLLAELLAQLAATSDPTATLRLLATAELPRENAIYAAHLAAASDLVRDMRTVDWKVLDGLADRDTDVNATAIIAELRNTAEHDEHEVFLGEQLRTAHRAGIDLFMTAPKAQEASHKPTLGSVTRRIPAAKVASVVEEICEAADANPAAEFEITWRAIT